MKKNTFLLLLLFITPAVLLAQTFTTPDTGVVWTLDDIANASPSTITVSGDQYELLENLEIAASDTVIIDEDLTLSIDADLLITVFGTFEVTADDVTFTAIDEAAPYEGFRFEEFSEINIQNSTIQFGGGLRVLTETFTLNNCTLTNNVEGATTGGTISLSRGVPQITNNTITFNQLPAISSGANIEVSPYIFNNYIEGNTQENSNRPQINLGITKVNDSLKIIQNTIKGDPALDQVGGIAIANFVGGNIRAIIDDNVITDNRYGITMLGNNSFAYMRFNVIEDNNTQGDPNLGGSGINLNTSSGGMEVIAQGNEIRRNLWGITLQGEASINLGDEVNNSGDNIFSENENSGQTFALYNNTPNTIQAKNNCWKENDAPNSLADAEEVIFHQPDDSSLGEVIFDPISCAEFSVEDEILQDFSFYPNPSKGTINFDNMVGFETLSVYDVTGKNVFEVAVVSGENTVNLPVAAGVYFIRFETDTEAAIRKLVVR
ncbi:T9SS type A sorting domain-containing protein [Flavobacteriaceae bacterium TK19130]|nr:T9SS type A sorting domain-containing protein [Thermobacterium salinum]